MANWTGKRIKIQFNKTNEPSFLTRFKEQVGFKEDNGLSDKFSKMPKATKEDTEDRDDEKPQIVQLEHGDLSKEQVENLTNQKEEVFKTMNDIPEKLEALQTCTNIEGVETLTDIHNNIKNEVPIMPMNSNEHPQEASMNRYGQSTQPTIENVNIDVSIIPLPEESTIPNEEVNDPNGPNPPWMNPEIRVALQNKKRASRKYQRSGLYRDLIEYKKACTTSRRLIRKARGYNRLEY